MEHIDKILTNSPLNFTTTSHDKTIYRTTYKGHLILLLRQVDDFALSCTNKDIARDIFSVIGSALQLPKETKPPFQYLGLLDDYNGVAIQQTATHTTLSTGPYIQRVLRSHGWNTPPSHSPFSDKLSPLPVDAIPTMYKAKSGPPEQSDEHRALERDKGFSYRTLLGELLYAYVVCRIDIGYAVTALSKFASAPAPVHYDLLKSVTKYLRATASWGLRFRRSVPDLTLPPDPFIPLLHDDSLPPFPPSDPYLTGFVDAAHANDLRNRRSTMGYAFVKSGAAVAFKSKTQTTTATSSTEAEFIAAVAASKTAIYLRSILTDLGFLPSSPTPLFEDNEAAIKIINNNHPTDRVHHLEIQHFAIQDWKKNGHITLHHIKGVLNPSDGLTKPLGWILHARHARRLMGHFT